MEENNLKKEPQAVLPSFVSSDNFKVGDIVLYEGYTCMVKKKQGQKCLVVHTPAGLSYFIPHWADVIGD